MEQAENISQFNQDFKNKYNDDNNQGYFHEVDVQYPEKLHNLYNDLLFLAEGMKIEKPTCMITKICYTYNKFKKNVLNHGLVLKKNYKIIKFNHEAWLKPYVDMKIHLKRNTRNDILKRFFQVDE